MTSQTNIKALLPGSGPMNAAGRVGLSWRKKPHRSSFSRHFETVEPPTSCQRLLRSRSVTFFNHIKADTRTNVSISQQSRRTRDEPLPGPQRRWTRRPDTRRTDGQPELQEPSLSKPEPESKGTKQQLQQTEQPRTTDHPPEEPAHHPSTDSRPGPHHERPHAAAAAAAACPAATEAGHPRSYSQHQDLTAETHPELPSTQPGQQEPEPDPGAEGPGRKY